MGLLKKENKFYKNGTKKKGENVRGISFERWKNEITMERGNTRYI